MLGRVRSIIVADLAPCRALTLIWRATCTNFMNEQKRIRTMGPELIAFPNHLAKNFPILLARTTAWMHKVHQHLTSFRAHLHNCASIWSSTFFRFHFICLIHFRFLHSFTLAVRNGCNLAGCNANIRQHIFPRYFPITQNSMCATDAMQCNRAGCRAAVCCNEKRQLLW